MKNRGEFYQRLKCTPSSFSDFHLRSPCCCIVLRKRKLLEEVDVGRRRFRDCGVINTVPPLGTFLLLALSRLLYLQANSSREEEELRKERNSGYLQTVSLEGQEFNSFPGINIYTWGHDHSMQKPRIVQISRHRITNQY